MNVDFIVCQTLRAVGCLKSISGNRFLPGRQSQVGIKADNAAAL